MKKLKNILKESNVQIGKVYSNPYATAFVKETEEREMNNVNLSEEQKQAFLEAVKQYKKYGEAVYRNAGLGKVYESIKNVVNVAEKLTLSETEDWFDNVTVSRHMKRMGESFKVFEKTLKEVSTLQQRLEASYDEIGEVLGKYYEISEELDPVGKEDGDIDNDGDEDASDEYLTNRRKVISKAMKNESMKLTDMIKKPSVNEAALELKKLEDAIKMFQDKIEKQGRVTNARDEEHLQNLIKVYKQMGGKNIKESVVNEDTKKRFDVDFYKGNGDRQTSQEEIIRGDKFSDIVSQATKVAKSKGMNYVEFYYKDSFIGSIDKRNGYEFKKGRDSEKSPLSINEAKYDIGMARKGNGIAVYNRAEEERGDYKNIAHISDNGTVKYYDKNIPNDVKKKIEAEAQKMKESVNEGGGTLNEGGGTLKVEKRKDGKHYWKFIFKSGKVEDSYKGFDSSADAQRDFMYRSKDKHGEFFVDKVSKHKDDETSYTGKFKKFESVNEEIKVGSMVTIDYPTLKKPIKSKVVRVLNDKNRLLYVMKDGSVWDAKYISTNESVNESKSMKLTSMIKESFGIGELPSSKLMKMNMSLGEIMNEGVSVSSLLKDVIKGSTSRVNGVKVSKVQAQQLLNLYDTMDLRNKNLFDKAPTKRLLNMLNSIGESKRR